MSEGGVGNQMLSVQSRAVCLYEPPAAKADVHVRALSVTSIATILPVMGWLMALAACPRRPRVRFCHAAKRECSMYTRRQRCHLATLYERAMSDAAHVAVHLFMP